MISEQRLNDVTTLALVLLVIMPIIIGIIVALNSWQKHKAGHTGSQRGEEMLANWPTFAAKFALVKPKSSDVKALLGHRSRSAAELRVQAQ